MRTAILGAGGHGRVALDCLRLLQPKGLKVVFYDDQYEHLQSVDGVEVRGPIYDVLRGGTWDGVFVAIGDNATRMRGAERMTKRQLRLLRIVHPQTIVSPNASIGDGSIAIAGAVVNTGAHVGRCSILNTLSSVGHGCIVEDYAQLASGVNLGGAAIVGRGAFLGIGAKVVPEVRIGAWSVVGAGSVVLHDLPDRAFCHGVPARVVRQLDPDERPSSAAEPGKRRNP